MKTDFDVNNLTPEDEIFILQEGLRSSFWRLLCAKWGENGKFGRSAMISLLSPKYPNKEFLSGKVRGIRDVLGWPERRLQTLLNPGKKEDEREM